jgi:hypothetical protein
MSMDNESHNTPESTNKTQPAENTPEQASITPPESVPEAVAPSIIPVPEVKPPPAWKKYPIRDYIWGIAACTVLLYVLNNLMNIYVPWIPGDFSGFFWNILNNVYNHVEIPFLSKAYIQCLWAINIALTAGILGNFILLLYHPRWAHHLIQALISGLSLIATYVVYAIYPFRLDSSQLDSIVKIILIIIMVSLAIAVINSFARFIIALLRGTDREEKAVSLATPLPEQSPKE